MGISSGNRFEALQSDRKGPHDLGIDDRWRLRFVWKRDGAHLVDILKPLGTEKMTGLLDEIHPGKVLLEDFMKPMMITARRLAANIDVASSRISDLVRGQRPITADTALRLGLYFGMEPVSG